MSLENDKIVEKYSVMNQVSRWSYDYYLRVILQNPRMISPQKCLKV